MRFNVAFVVGSGGGDNNIVGVIVGIIAIAFAITVSIVIVILIIIIVTRKNKGMCIANITPIEAVS